MPGRATGSVSLQNFHDDIRKDLYSHRQYYDALVYSKHRPTAVPLRMRVTIPCLDFFPRQEMNSARLRGSLLPPRLRKPEYDVFLDVGAEWHAEVCTPTSLSYLDTIEFTYEGRVVRILDAQSEEEDHWIMVVDLAWREGDCLAWRIMCNITPEFGCGLRRVLRNYLDNGTHPAIAFTGDYHSMNIGTDGVSKLPVYQPWSISLLEGLQRSGYPRIFTPNNPEPPTPTFIPCDTILQNRPAFRDASTQTIDPAPNVANSYLPGSPSTASSVSSPNEGTPGVLSLKGGDLVAPFVRAIWAGLGTFLPHSSIAFGYSGRGTTGFLQRPADGVGTAGSTSLGLAVVDDDVEERHESQSGISESDEGSTDDSFSASPHRGTVDGGHPSGRDDPRRSGKLKRKRSEDADEAGEMVQRRRAV